MKSTHPQWLRRQALALLAFAPLFAVSAAAQSAPTAAQSDEAVKLEKFVVTGSYIPIAGTATAIPVTTVDATTIANTGVSTSLLEVLRKTTPQFIGNGNLGVSNADISAGATGGGSSVALRNAQTLVLLNGRRAAYSPILASGGAQFFDVNLIPIAAVERIEILQDGASAIYGTDAVAGVVNIILKSNFQGFEANGRYAFSDNSGNYAERKFSLTGGVSNGKSSLTVSGEWTRTDPLFQYDREFSAESFGTPTYGGIVNDDATGRFYILNPALNAPPLNQDLTIAQLVANGTYIPLTGDFIDGIGAERQYAFNLASYVTLLQGQERGSAVVNFEHKWTDAVTVFGDFLYTQTDTFLQINAQPVNSSRAGSDPFNPSNQTLRARNRFTAFPRQYFYNSTSMRGIVGLRGELGDYTWETAANRNRIEQDYRNVNVVNTAARAAAVASGLLNMFARTQTPGAIEASGMFGTAIGLAESTLENYDARLTGKLMDLPAGELGFAVGAEYRVETLRQTSDVFSQTATFGWDSATTLDPTSANRNVTSAFVNLRLPVFGGNQAMPGFHLLEFEGALRSEKYSDTDDPTVPKLTMRWLPFSDEFAVRATYSESFAAPTLFQLFGPSLIGSTNSLSLNRFGGGPNITGQANALGGSNRNLRPSESTNYTFGVVWSPKALKGFSVSLDYFNIEQTDLIAAVGTDTILQDVELLGTASIYANRVRFGPADDFSQFTAGAPVTAAGQIGNRPIDTVYVSDFNTNIAQVNISGFDLKANYTWNADPLGRFDFSLAAGYFAEYTVTPLPGEAPQETAGLATFFNGTIPEWQTYFSAAWARGPWGATFGWTHIPEVTDENWFDANDTTADARVEPFNSIDVGVHYTFGTDSRWLNGLTLRLGANNVLNEMPPQAKGSFPNGNADLATYGAVGRLMFIEARYKF